MARKFGAAISRREYIRVTLAAGIGSVLEWYDYTVLIAMSPAIQQSFFPPGDTAAKMLSFWSVYAVGYIFRPLGSLLFGHICDVHGRRLSLLITLIMMAIATVLIGCLPTYTQAGLAAPILLSLLRLVQGIAVGGELGTAVVFMHELAPAGGKTKGGSVVFLGVTAGILMGIIVSMIVTAAIPHGALLHWGWRIPFLVAFLTAAVGLMLRYHMPESFEFEADPVKLTHRQQQQQHNQQASKAKACASSSSSDTQHDPQQLSKLLPADTEQHGMSDHTDTAHGLDSHQIGVEPAEALNQQQLMQQQPVQQQSKQQQSVAVSGPTASQSSRCSWVLGHDPVKMLFRDHWREVLLLFWFETWSAANFYVFYGWLPSYMQVQWKVNPELTMGMTLVNMSMTLALIPCAAHLADQGLPRLAATAVVLAIAALASVPMLLAVSSKKLVAAWLMQACDLFLNASIFGWLPSIGSLLFPVHVRATGYNFGHTAAQSWLGGLTPVIISAIALRLQQSGAPSGAIYLVTGLYLTACAIISLVALAIMWRMFPQTNRDQCQGIKPALPMTGKEVSMVRSGRQDVSSGAAAALSKDADADAAGCCSAERPRD